LSGHLHFGLVDPFAEEVHVRRLSTNITHIRSRGNSVTVVNILAKYILIFCNEPFGAPCCLAAHSCNCMFSATVIKHYPADVLRLTMDHACAEWLIPASSVDAALPLAVYLNSWSMIDCCHLMGTAFSYRSQLMQGNCSSRTTGLPRMVSSP